MYNKVPTDLNFVAREKEVEKFWEDHDIFQKSIDNRKKAETYTFYDGPPTANGKPHIGHVLTRVIKDMIPRYRTMKGCDVPRKAGWDTHGLPVELEVEKMLGLDGKEQIEEYGLEPFIKHCKDGSTRACGKISPRLSASGRIWMIRTLPMRITISSPSGGLSSRSGKRGFSTRDLRSFLTVRDAERRFPATRWPRDIRT